MDIMVNNAGVSGTMHRRFLDDDLADFHRVMAVNVLGSWRAPAMPPGTWPPTAADPLST
ncbi:putative 3-oxoacyl-[acyl-carrier-protein] reductase [Mycobacterium kansasii]|uniref:Putative 3-oxoacyl-[acyl-carrier-protein] reductase n=1 Tax=Mycobacterium kansasii TaxID=1768 RepID=A0A1V3WW66_MYCKA|nr:putative 3-oxoacyl-[acyl-carrier-protein] reductase [Mycobacterium kansasii]